MSCKNVRDIILWHWLTHKLCMWLWHWLTHILCMWLWHRQNDTILWMWLWHWLNDMILWMWFWHWLPILDLWLWDSLQWMNCQEVRCSLELASMPCLGHQRCCTGVWTGHLRLSVEVWNACSNSCNCAPKSVFSYFFWILRQKS